MEIVIPVASWQRAGHVYRVRLSDSGDECDCPDFFWRHINRNDESHHCKHIAAARQLLVDGVPGPRHHRHAHPRPVGRAALAA